MTDQRVFFYPRREGFSTFDTLPDKGSQTEDPTPRIEPATCAEAETFVLQVLDDSMEPEFRKGCVIVIDPTGRATDGSYVLARRQIDQSAPEKQSSSVGDYVFRQLKRTADNEWVLVVLNPVYASVAPVPVLLTDIIGVIVQRAGTRRRYHKRYD